ncbi:uncharacterized protein LOC129753002 [Uranotaenia lowii]|uniref:uncharacterized protein LOC129753002 n=1 Tax=Uranotaenia lowii TaxID=190385 RepID=UPI00247ADE1A|nr:uncharacterized protein LOC129753002 [Uranotaenia lowii]
MARSDSATTVLTENDLGTRFFDLRVDHLEEDELSFELEIRGIKFGESDNIARKRRSLRERLKLEREENSEENRIFDRNPQKEIEICEAKLVTIEEVCYTNVKRLPPRLRSVLLHLGCRIVLLKKKVSDQHDLQFLETLQQRVLYVLNKYYYCNWMGEKEDGPANEIDLEEFFEEAPVASSDVQPVSTVPIRDDVLAIQHEHSREEVEELDIANSLARLGLIDSEDVDKRGFRNALLSLEQELIELRKFKEAQINTQRPVTNANEYQLSAATSANRTGTVPKSTVPSSLQSGMTRNNARSYLNNPDCNPRNSFLHNDSENLSYPQITTYRYPVPVTNPPIFTTGTRPTVSVNYNPSWSGLPSGPNYSPVRNTFPKEHRYQQDPITSTELPSTIWSNVSGMAQQSFREPRFDYLNPRENDTFVPYSSYSNRNVPSHMPVTKSETIRQSTNNVYPYTSVGYRQPFQSETMLHEPPRVEFALPKNLREQNVPHYYPFVPQEPSRNDFGYRHDYQDPNFPSRQPTVSFEDRREYAQANFDRYSDRNRQFERHRGRSHNSLPVSKWALEKYAGNDQGLKLNEFLTLVSQLALSERISEDELFDSAFHLFTGPALNWYMTLRSAGRLSSWQHLIQELRNTFVHPELDSLLRTRIYLRRQQRNETFQDFYFEMEGMFRSMLHPMSDEEKLNVIKRNMRVDYKKLILWTPINNLTELREAGHRIDASNFSLYPKFFGTEKSILAVMDTREQTRTNTSTGNRPPNRFSSHIGDSRVKEGKSQIRIPEKIDIRT